MEGIRNNERCLFFSFEEMAEQLINRLYVLDGILESMSIKDISRYSVSAGFQQRNNRDH